MKSIYKTAVNIIIFLCLTQFSFAQQEPQFTQYMDNLSYYNPAYAGSRNVMSFNALHRQQWAGFKGAPMSTTFGFHTPLRYDNIGIGVSLVNDRLGPTNNFWANVDISYSLKFKKHDGRLSFGVKAGISDLNGDIASLRKTDAIDDALNFRYNNKINFNVGVGIYYHSKYWFIGAAVPRIIENIPNNSNNMNYSLNRHYYFMVGGYIPVSRMIKIRPNAMVKFTQNAPVAVDFGTSVIIYDKFWIGANYRLLAAAGLIFQWQITDQFKLGYAFEMTTNKMGTNSYGTHELMLGFDLKFKNKSITSPRFF